MKQWFVVFLILLPLSGFSQEAQLVESILKKVLPESTAPVESLFPGVLSLASNINPESRGLIYQELLAKGVQPGVVQNIAKASGYDVSDVASNTFFVPSSGAAPLNGQKINLLVDGQSVTGTVNVNFKSSPTSLLNSSAEKYDSEATISYESNGSTVTKPLGSMAGNITKDVPTTGNLLRNAYPKSKGAVTAADGIVDAQTLMKNPTFRSVGASQHNTWLKNFKGSKPRFKPVEDFNGTPMFYASKTDAEGQIAKLKKSCPSCSQLQTKYYDGKGYLVEEDIAVPASQLLPQVLYNRNVKLASIYQPAIQKAMQAKMTPAQIGELIHDIWKKQNPKEALANVPYLSLSKEEQAKDLAIGEDNAPLNELDPTTSLALQNYPGWNEYVAEITSGATAERTGSAASGALPSTGAPPVNAQPVVPAAVQPSAQ